MSYPYSLTPGTVTLQENGMGSGANSLTERRFAQAIRQKELLDNQRVYSLKLDNNRLVGYDRLLFGPNALTSLYPNTRKLSTSQQERMTAFQQQQGK
jgi:hypothetical protein